MIFKKIKELINGKSVDDVVGKFQVAAQELAKVEEQQLAKANRENVKLAAADKAVNAAIQEANRASKVAKNINALLTGE